MIEKQPTSKKSFPGHIRPITRYGVKGYRLDFRDQSSVRVREFVAGSLTDAKQMLTRRLGEVQRGIYVNLRQAKKSARNAGVTFAEFYDEKFTEYASERRSTYYADTIRGRNPKRPSKGIWAFFSERRMRDLERNPTLFDQFRRQRLGEGLSPETVRKELGVLNVMFNQARRLGVVQRNPLVDVDKPERTYSDSQKGRPLTLDEVRDTIAALEEQDPWLAPLFRFALSTGLRLKEVVLLTWDRIDRQQGFASVSSDNKSGRPRTIPLGLAAFESLDSLSTLRHVSGRVFLDEHGSPLDDEKGRNRVSQRTAAAMRAAGVQSTAEGKASFKASRTTIGTVLAEAGHSLYLVGELLGHAWARQTVTAEYYARVRTKELRPLVDTFDEWLRQVGNSGKTSHSRE